MNKRILASLEVASSQASVLAVHPTPPCSPSLPRWFATALARLWSEKAAIWPKRGTPNPWRSKKSHTNVKLAQVGDHGPHWCVLKPLSSLSGDPVTQEKPVLRPSYHFIWWLLWRIPGAFEEGDKAPAGLSWLSLVCSHSKVNDSSQKAQGWDLVNIPATHFNQMFSGRLHRRLFQRHKIIWVFHFYQLLLLKKLKKTFCVISGTMALRPLINKPPSVNQLKE